MINTTRTQASEPRAFCVTERNRRSSLKGKSTAPGLASTLAAGPAPPGVARPAGRGATSTAPISLAGPAPGRIPAEQQSARPDPLPRQNQHLGEASLLWVSLQQWAFTWGILIQFFIQFGVAQVGGGPDDPNQPTSAFRIPWGVQMVPAFVLLVGLFFFLYSPRWLASKDRWDEALNLLHRFPTAIISTSFS
ncbi:hypothetical protein QBC37DRAFT_399723 [Rhypophila decipiens]|uniref:Uncharacterized protein n=1 Tax=Rhypophila decipiens TaxID=261697 RepID=A0AAN7B843_9PEZI|nr:hypothetical protein QBC37DRAFT_399723 [Rhypophila decipiens]